MQKPFSTSKEIKEMSTADLIKKMKALLAELDARTAKRASDEKSLRGGSSRKRRQD